MQLEQSQTPESSKAEAAKETPSQMPKRIVICFDGTWDDTGDTPERTKPGSKVSRFSRWILPPLLWQLLWIFRVFALFKWIEHHLLGLGPKERSTLVTNASLLASAIKPLGTIPVTNNNHLPVHQVVLYIGGIGALGNPQSRLEEAVTGNTMTYKVRYAYRLIVDNYQVGDEILLFGFSRGAFAARAIAAFITSHGVFKKGALDEFDVAWRAFTQTNLKSQQLYLTQESDPVYDRPSIKCIGVWDTVGSLGPPPLSFFHKNDVFTARAAHTRHGQFDIGFQPKADYAFQALALDERRFDFYPALWAFPERLQYPDRFCQTWFPGVHTDTGGGNPGGLSQYALIWMISKIQQHKLLDLDDKFINETILDHTKNAAPPWNLPIRGRDYVELYLPMLSFLIPKRIKNQIRVAHRNPYIPATASIGAMRGGIAKTHSKLHWTVVERVEKTDGVYWESCPTLRKQDPFASRRIMREPTKDDIRTRMETPVGIDFEMMQNWVGKECVD